MEPLASGQQEQLSQLVEPQQQSAQERPGAAADAENRASSTLASHSAAAPASVRSPPPPVAAAAAAGAEIKAAAAEGPPAAAVVIPEEAAAAGGEQEAIRFYEERRKLLQEKRSKQLHWGTSLQVYTPVQVWINTYEIRPAALGPGFEAGKMVNNRGLLISTYKWTHANPADVRGAIILYHSYTSHALWDFLRHQRVQQEGESGPGHEKQQLQSQGVNTCPVEAAAGATGTPGPFPGEDDLRHWVPQYPGSWVEALYTQGFNVYAVDHQSHGHSEGWRGWRCNVQDFFCFVEDSLQFLSEVVACDPRTPAAAPIYLLGYSMGGNIALQTVGALFSPLTAAAYYSVAADAASLPSQHPPPPAATAVANTLATTGAGAAAPSGAAASHAVASGAAASPSQRPAAAAKVRRGKGTQEHQQVSPLVRERVKAVVLLAPLIRILVDRKTKILSKINVHLLSHCMPNLRLVRSAGGPGYEYLDWWYEKDLFAYAGRAKSRMVANLFRAAQQVQRSIKCLPPQLKVLCLQGTRDMTVDYRGPLALTKSPAKVDLIYLTGWSHYLAKEKGSELLTDLVVAWLRAKLQADTLSAPGNGEEGSSYRRDDGSGSGSKQPPVLFDFVRHTELQRGNREGVDTKNRLLVDKGTQTEAEEESAPAASASEHRAVMPAATADEEGAAVSAV